MGKLLEPLRKKAGLTLEEAASRLDVPASVIQYWEKTDRIPKNQFHYVGPLCDLYGIDIPGKADLMLAMYTKKEEEAETDNFPAFLFRDNPEHYDIAKSVDLSEEELELFGYDEFLKEEEGNENGPTAEIKYNIYEKHGGIFRAKHMLRAAKRKVKKLDKLPYFEILFLGPEQYLERADRKSSAARVLVMEEGIRTEGKSFSFCKLPTYYIADFLGLTQLIRIVREAGKKKLCIGTTMSYNELKGTLGGIIKYKRVLADGNSYKYVYEFSSGTPSLYTDCLRIEKAERSDKEYLARKERAEAVRKPGDDPVPMEGAPFVSEYTYYLGLTDTGNKLLEWFVL